MAYKIVRERIDYDQVGREITAILDSAGDLANLGTDFCPGSLAIIAGAGAATTNSIATYEWTVPHGVKRIAVAIDYNSGGATNRYSRFTVTTT